ncbi:DUF3472 domain-containing protein [Sphingobacterium hungaricum]|uniref:Nematoblast specific protein n=1 Tax=Sphingobacterium hungaricum TaxID=2082723 RepID=A0A928YQQ1_9SPHI|nr:DUF3472 domain-containing protein [Sphingobacterium hungaricum]MBE8713280.1 nematoblast specific protein [Sphingobacterium hungaricum]
MKHFLSTLFILFFGYTSVLSQQTDSILIEIPIEGNSWFSPKSASNRSDLKRKLESWNSINQALKTYVYFSKPGKFTLSLVAGKLNEYGDFKLEAFGKSTTISFAKNDEKVYVGNFEVAKSGYYPIQLTKKNATHSPVFNRFEIQGLPEFLSGIDYVKNNEGNFFYWGRRGASVHLSYELPNEKEITYFYNELIVPEGNDVLGSYFMANGFGEGYFGMQVNSPTERRVLFSVWSPFHTDNPKEIPEDQVIKLISKGANVNTGEFGNEGSGGQSYLVHNWKAGEKYKFLLRGKPVENNYTEFTAWFFSPEWNEWRLIAKFQRPKTKTYLTRLHSFLENFLPEQGDVSRKLLIANQWAYDTSGNWHELTKAKFTVDETGSKSFRMDYAGGVDGDNFYLKNCGFFNQFTKANTDFVRNKRGVAPVIDFKSLPE